mmetsp:Transcript_7715/g.19050  ORF Transcript_7715/g.19050 Transcript_7715/m.19050 type:complete len:84 (-) Transcript_7715:272-523(-)
MPSFFRNRCAVLDRAASSNVRECAIEGADAFTSIASCLSMLAQRFQTATPLVEIVTVAQPCLVNLDDEMLRRVTRAPRCTHGQ